jgi:hypothetical protein
MAVENSRVEKTSAKFRMWFYYSRIISDDEYNAALTFYFLVNGYP